MFQGLPEPDQSLLFYLFCPASLSRSGAPLKLMTSKFGVSNCHFRGFALSLCNSRVPEVSEARGGEIYGVLTFSKWLWKRDTVFSVSQCLQTNSFWCRQAKKTLFLSNPVSDAGWALVSSQPPQQESSSEEKLCQKLALNNLKSILFSPSHHRTERSTMNKLFLPGQASSQTGTAESTVLA